jgi:hypothetical protein
MDRADQERLAKPKVQSAVNGISSGHGTKLDLWRWFLRQQTVNLLAGCGH